MVFIRKFNGIIIVYNITITFRHIERNRLKHWKVRQKQGLLSNEKK